MQLSCQGIHEKVAQRVLCLRNRHAVQVNFRLHAILPPAKFLEHGAWNTGPIKDQFVAAGECGIVLASGEALAQDSVTIGAGKASLRRRTALARDLPLVAERLDVADGGTK